jgi:hypothetical protein
MRHLILIAALFALVAPVNAEGSGGTYTFSGGSEPARAAVRAALEASAFDWGLVPEPVTIQISACGCAGARPGAVVLDERLLESTPYGRAYTWGIVLRPRWPGRTGRWRRTPMEGEKALGGRRSRRLLRGMLGELAWVDVRRLRLGDRTRR